MNGVKIFGGMIGISIVITAIITYITKVKFSLSSFLIMVMIVILSECIIAGLWGFIQDVIRTYKEEGTFGTIVILTMFLIWTIAFVYVKDYMV